jgi:hypothetical protein
MLSKVKAFFQRLSVGGRPLPQRVVLSDQGFQLYPGDASHAAASVLWDDVIEIRTYKWDMFSYDDICLAFTTNGESWTEVSEEADGWVDLGRAMCERFTDVPANWLLEVMTPAFETNLRVLYRNG